MISPTLTVALTGGIASGKSLIADRFGELGANVIDTDIIAREVVAPGQPALEAIAGEFGDRVIAEDGTLDRPAMRRIIFSDDDARRRLEAIVHPRIRETALERAAEGRGDYQLLVVPLLTESSMRNEVDRIVVVDCDENDQIQRLIRRDGESEGGARRILAAQASREDRLAIADHVIHNEGSVEEALAQVDALHAEFLKVAG
ncbi:MAG: dephospho-CoA kinase [Pseudomonadota bacterium]